MRDFTEIWQLQDTIITAVNACGYCVWDLHATSWGFHLELTVPLFQSVANVLAEEMARMNVEELARQLDCSSKIFSSSFGNLLSPPLQLYKASYGK